MERARKAAKLIPASDVWKLLEGADVQLRAMILLALNGGMGSTNCAQLPRAALEQRPGWLDYPRPKTGTARRFPLWPETIHALAAVHRPDVALRPLSLGPTVGYRRPGGPDPA